MPASIEGLNPNAYGLASMLDLKARGRLPTALSDVVVPTIDLTHWYGQDKTESLINTIGLASSAAASPLVILANNSTLAVPTGEVWWVRHSCHQFVDGTGTLTALNLQHFAHHAYMPYSPAAGAQRHPMVGKPTNPVNLTWAGASPAISLTTPALRDYWAPAGTIWGFSIAGYATNAAAGTVALVAMVTFDRFRV